MDDQAKSTALISALTTEHFVLQTAASSTIAEAAARSTLYVMALSSALVAMAFASQSQGVLVPFGLVVLPAVFVLGVFTVVRLVDTVLENQQYLTGIARIRRFYKSLSPDAERYLRPDTARWPEAAMIPSLTQGPFMALLGTTAAMIAFLNNLVAGAAVALGVSAVYGRDHLAMALAVGLVVAAIFMATFVSYQKKRFEALQKVFESSGK
jgi:MFS family permease